MNIYLIVPNSRGILERPTSPHNAIAYIAAVLLRARHKVQVLDMRLGYNNQDLFNKLNDFKPDLIGVTATSADRKLVYSLSKELNKKGYKTVLGGALPSTLRKRVLYESKFDYAVKGEGEETIVELCSNNNLDQIDGLIWRKGKEIIENKDRAVLQDLDSLPFPAFELFELEKYMDQKISIVSSRGCPYRCVYCSIYFTMGKKFRARSPENVVAEIEKWYKKGFKYFQFPDDCFTFDMDRVEKICDLILKKRINIKWDLRNGIRVDRVRESMLKKMKDAGCYYIAYGVESGNQQVLNKMKKGITLEQARKAVLMTKKLGIGVGCFFIVGLPDDNFKRFKETLKFALSLPVEEVRFYNIVPYEETELFQWIKDGNARLVYPEEEYLDHANRFGLDPLIESKDFTLEERKKALEIGEDYVMKYITKKEFGPLLGYIAWQIWRPKITRYFIIAFGKKIWTRIRYIKHKLKKA